MTTNSQGKSIECWDVFELELRGPSEVNPFVDISLSARFTLEDEEFSVQGFYDGNGVYKIRFMPNATGHWRYETICNYKLINGLHGEFTCIPPSPGNHGPVRVTRQYHFAYADGKPFYPFGTTCYAWIHQGKDIESQTLASLEKAPFNKIRMCVFPKNYANNANEPERYPFKGSGLDNWDIFRFNPIFFSCLENHIRSLMKMGIEADLILFHPYDQGRWGFDRMDHDTDVRYLKYLIARLSSFQNVWWSMANEYDYMKEKTKEDWDTLIEVVAGSDPYRHLLSIHNGEVLYDHWNPAITHASVQIGTIRAGFGRFRMLRDAYKKPVIYDEVGYEGNLPQRWGHLSAEEMVDKFWHGVISGTYVSHGETFTHPQDIIWWSKGGTLRGKSPKRIAFLRKILEESGIGGLDPIDKWWVLDAAGKNGEYYLFYFGYEKPREWVFELPAFNIPIPLGIKFHADIIDTWNMKITPVEEAFEITDQGRYSYTCSYNPKVELPGREFIALRIKRIE